MIPAGRPANARLPFTGDDAAPAWPATFVGWSERGPHGEQDNIYSVEGISAEVNLQGRGEMYGGWGGAWGWGGFGPWWRGPTICPPTVVTVNNPPFWGFPGKPPKKKRDDRDDPRGPRRSARVATTATPPRRPSTGETWWNTVDGNLYVWYDDGTSGQWVPATASAGAGAGGGIGEAPMDGSTYARKLGQWVSVWDSGRV